MALKKDKLHPLHILGEDDVSLVLKVKPLDQIVLRLTLTAVLLLDLTELIVVKLQAMDAINIIVEKDASLGTDDVTDSREHSHVPPFKVVDQIECDHVCRLLWS